MRIIVNNQHEADLIRRFLNDGHEYGIMDLLKDEMGKYPDDELELEGADFRILEEAMFYENPRIEIDSKEKELWFQDDEFVVGTCVHCGKETNGLINGDPLSYDGWLRINSEESRKTWKCEDCGNKMCPECGEYPMESSMDDECAKCAADREVSHDR